MEPEPKPPSASFPKHFAWFEPGGFFVNLAGVYDYLEMPYYLSQDFENQGTPVHPTPKEILDAYITPLFLEKAKQAGLPVALHYISNGYFEAPVVIDPINPFLLKSRTVLKPGREASTAKSMTRNHTYAICCQEIPPGAKIVHFRAVLGWCKATRFAGAAQQVWELYKIPLAKVRVFVLPDGSLLYSDLAPLAFEELGNSERNYLETKVKWQK
ncbi:MAG: hypothetical protein A2600_09195 [Candidatus Lambdaproteobacteria bacterium RIFOXYD1_FULL_56_27]|uniref:RimK-like ATPgrasp N-terminal domain-containing protein n=1 Tax=Candidatus Lambdaproteobacteria bacterium RIFOXYD2_FULL_56_26 TaxID=1817773 RepID=A0A1F6GL96_9PROT|nr:MAG: hypothetical protein A2557_13320 [Candidatus Lambdaproteobacteria bacterium RIFOXYD2_FULL_56_26]OGH03593.1 MAG: hypothetical protein A2426_06510 [Candidatus Lambdaproteobacteria bacterium RIFOXYC1_FULL_56_13]OGH08730.1 MAG: hypothetical protein A2600_09195 [Candidatus Lambdaproteobacteria bacterium RIFOXYD1_FULL_56_27]